MRRIPPIKFVFRQNVFFVVFVVFFRIYDGARRYDGPTIQVGTTVQRSIASAVLTELGAGRREAGGGQEEGKQEGEAEVTHPSGGEPASVGCGLKVRRRSGTIGGWPVTGE